MKRHSVLILGLFLGISFGAEAAVSRVAPGPGYRYRVYEPGAVKPTGFLAEFARRQAEGTLSHRHEALYPFDQEMWAQAITNLHYANPMWRAPDRPYSEANKRCPWVPYEQTGYMLDGMARLSFLVDAPGVRADYLKSLESVLANATDDGKLARFYDNADHNFEWPFVIFARSAFAWFEGTGDRRVLDALVRHYKAFRGEYFGWKGREAYNAEMLVLLSEYTGDRSLVDDAVKMFEKNGPAWYRPDEKKRILDHGVSFTESLKLPAVLTLGTGDRKWLEKGERILDTAFELNEQPDGMISANEFLSGRDPRQGHEACVVSDMIWTLGYYLEADGRAIDGDRMERIAYNALPGHMTKDFRRYQYLSFVNQAQVTPFSSHTHFAPRAKHAQYRPNLFFECCMGNIQRALPNFILRLWMKDEQTGAPVAMLHGPSRLQSEYNGVAFTLEEETDYPFSDTVRFVFHAAQPLEMPLKYRVPSWARRPDAGRIACETRVWKDGDVFETRFPSDVTLKSDRNWHWFTKGALSFAYPVPSAVEEERPGDPYSPLILTPNGPWNWAVDPAALAQAMPVAEYRPNGKFPYDESPLTLKVPMQGLAEWRVFDSGKWMPDPPLFAHPSGERATVTLVPEGATLARVTAFPDVTPRKELPVPCAYVYDGKRYDYDPSKPLADQKGGPETDAAFSFDFLLKDDPPQQGLDDFYDLGNRFDTTKNSFAYLVFAVWSDAAGEATAALSGAHSWQVFLEGREVARNLGIQEGRYMMPEWFPIVLKPGYNWVVVKVATPSWVGTYRREWGAKLQVFVTPRAAALERAFDNPPQSAGAWAWWHWCGGNVSAAGITRDLEAMRDAGLGGATMFNIQAKGTEEPMENALNPAFGYRNDEYWRLLEFATAEAKRLGLALGAHNCTGYSTAGGPWIAPEQSMKKVVWTKAKIPSGASADAVVLPQPETVRGFYRDIGRVTVGDTVYRFGFTSTGKLTHPAPPDIADKALEADKMDAAAINWHWDNVLGGFLKHVPPSNPGFTHILIDSYEAGPSNWTWDFREEFARRRGYDPLPKLPALDNAFSEEENARFAADLAQTVKELYTERYYDVSQARVKAGGYELHLEPYSGPFDSWDASARCDVPMTEFWQGPVPWSKTVREGGGTWMAGPVGRAYGRPISGAESFTACPEADHWSYAPRHLKRAIDLSLVQGINRFSLHDWVHQPLAPQYLPGFSMGFWGTHFGENQTWHEPGKAMYRYLQRCQALLQRGLPEGDALGLVYTDDPTDDAIGLRDFLRDVDVTADGRVRVVPSGRTYPLLMLNPKGDYSAPEVKAKLQRLLAAGATVAAPKGLLVPEGKGHLLQGLTRHAALAAIGLAPQFEVVDAQPALGDKADVRAFGRVDGDVRFYFVVNTSDTDYTLAALFRAGDRAPELWFPADGRKERSPCWRTEGARTRVDFRLAAHTSAFVVFDRPAGSPSGPAPMPETVDVASVAGPWRVSFQPGRGAMDGTIEMAELASLTTRDEPGVKYFSGTATYETTFALANVPWQLTIDLGDVRDIAEVALNGQDLGVAWYAPFRVDATHAVKVGENRLVVKVTNCWQNRLIGDRLLPQDTPHDAHGKKMWGVEQGVGIRLLPEWLLKGEKSPTGRICFTTWDYFAARPDEPLAPSGLLGPVRLLVRRDGPSRRSSAVVSETAGNRSAPGARMRPASENSSVMQSQELEQ